MEDNINTEELENISVPEENQKKVRPNFMESGVLGKKFVKEIKKLSKMNKKHRIRSGYSKPTLENRVKKRKEKKKRNKKNNPKKK